MRIDKMITADYSSLPNTREEALAAGITFYFNGKPCRWARHIAPRYVSVNKCVICQAEATKRLVNKDRAAFNRKNKERRDLDLPNQNAIIRARYWADPKKSRADCLTKYYRNHDKNKALSKARREADPERYRGHSRDARQRHKSRISEYNRAYKAANRHIYAAAATARYTRKKNALPAWADLDEIKTFYQEARQRTLETGVEHQVDHIIPLQGKNVCGLHVAWNLQVITKRENVRKSNRILQE